MKILPVQIKSHQLIRYALELKMKRECFVESVMKYEAEIEKLKDLLKLSQDELQAKKEQLFLAQEAVKVHEESLKNSMTNAEEKERRIAELEQLLEEKSELSMNIEKKEKQVAELEQDLQDKSGRIFMLIALTFQQKGSREVGGEVKKL